VAAIIGTVLVALCCFTPLLVVTFGIVGLSVLTPYLDYILLPALVVMVIVTVISYRKWRQSRMGDEVNT
jgi:mercuric ion transport protein